jgi:hypothetical protein
MNYDINLLVTVENVSDSKKDFKEIVKMLSQFAVAMSSKVVEMTKNEYEVTIVVNSIPTD